MDTIGSLGSHGDWQEYDADDVKNHIRALSGEPNLENAHAVAKHAAENHVIEAINRAAKHGRKSPDKLWSLYIGVYSDKDRKHIEQIEGKFKCKVHIYDAKTAHVWG